MLVYDHCMFSSSRLFRMLAYCSLVRWVSPRNLQCKWYWRRCRWKDSGFWKPKFTRAALLFLLIRYFKPLRFIVNIASELPERTLWPKPQFSIRGFFDVTWSKRTTVSEYLSCGGRLYCACINVAHVPGALLCVRLWMSIQATSKT